MPCGHTKSSSPQTIPPSVTPTAGTDASTVTIGTVSIPRGLYNIYTNEAAEHIKVLKAECAKWRQAMPAEASQDFMRAAHTLASTSRTAGFIPLAE